MLAEGELIAGRYRLRGLLGEGGMASVWRADDLRLDRAVAVKFLDTKSGQGNEEATAQFLREAKIAAAVQHRNVIQTVDFGAMESGQPYMVMELLHGRTLAERIATPPPLPIAEVVRICLLTLRGLNKVHEAGIVHRDLKPDNVFLVEDGDGPFPKILDFGISRSVDPSSGRKSALTTSDGLIVGTPEYMSPEQARGLRDLDRRTDIYSMGVILYECVTGKRPYESEHTGDLIIMVVNGGAPPAIKLRPEVGKPLSDVIAKAMSRKREHRYADVREMQRALEEVASSLDAGMRRSHSMMPPAAPLGGDDGLEFELPASDPSGLPGTDTPDPGRDATTLEVELGEAAASAMRLMEGDAIAPSPSPTQRGVESWSEIRRAHGNPWPRRAALAAAVVLVVGLGVWAIAPQDDIQTTAITTSPNVSPAPENVAPHVVELDGLPDGATILLDGKPAVGPHVELPSGETSKHTIQVIAPGMMPWFVVHGAGSQHRYDVRMTAAAPPASQPMAEPTTQPTKSKAGSTATTKTNVAAPSKTTSNTVSRTPRRPTKPPTKPPTAFRDLDF